MAANGISTLSTKELKQRAKLDLAQINRAASGNLRSVYDITQLPTRYSGNDIIDNPNIGGLILGRPWISDLDIIVDNIELENGDDLLLETGNFILLES